MNNIGLLFFLLVSLFIGFRLLRGTQFSEEMIRKGEEATKNHARELTQEENRFWSERNAEMVAGINMRGGLIEKSVHFSDSDIRVEAMTPDPLALDKPSEPGPQKGARTLDNDRSIPQKGARDAKILEDDKAIRLKEGQLEIRIYIKTGPASSLRILDLEGKLAGNEIFLAAVKSHLAVVWLTDSQNAFGTATNPMQLLHLKVIDPLSETERFSGVVFSQRYGIRNLTGCYHAKSDSLVFAWEDISKPNSDMLYFAVEPVSQILAAGGTRLKPFALFPEDRWEKRSPKFHKSGESIFLSNRTGDNFGLFAHSGKPCLGISILDSAGKPSQYGIIAVEGQIRGEVEMLDQTIFFQEYDASGSKFIGTKAIEFEKIFRVSQMGK